MHASPARQPRKGNRYTQSLAKNYSLTMVTVCSYLYGSFTLNIEIPLCKLLSSLAIAQGRYCCGSIMGVFHWFYTVDIYLTLFLLSTEKDEEEGFNYLWLLTLMLMVLVIGLLLGFLYYK